MPTTPAIAAFGGPISAGLTSGSGFFLIRYEASAPDVRDV
jgi:hypothetical protein